MAHTMKALIILLLPPQDVDKLCFIPRCDSFGLPTWFESEILDSLLEMHGYNGFNSVLNRIPLV